jgi:hypothetical protein
MEDNLPHLAMKKKLLAILIDVPQPQRAELLQEMREVIGVFSRAGKPRPSRRANPPASHLDSVPSALFLPNN